jgi:hypothetical protein
MTPWTGYQPVARPLRTQDNTNTEKTQTYIHASSGIGTHDSSVWWGEDICPLGHESTQIGLFFLSVPQMWFFRFVTMIYLRHERIFCGCCPVWLTSSYDLPLLVCRTVVWSASELVTTSLSTEPHRTGTSSGHTWTRCHSRPRKSSTNIPRFMRYLGSKKKSQRVKSLTPNIIFHSPSCSSSANPHNLLPLLPVTLSRPPSNSY